MEYGRETAGASHIMMQKPSLPKQEYSKLGMIMRGEITSSNSNDSGIQHDVNIGSSESLKVSLVIFFVTKNTSFSLKLFSSLRAFQGLLLEVTTI